MSANLTRRTGICGNLSRLVLRCAAPWLFGVMIQFAAMCGSAAEPTAGVMVVSSRVPRAVALELVAGERSLWKGNLRAGAVRSFTLERSGELIITTDKGEVRHEVRGDQAYILAPQRERHGIELRQLGFGEQRKADEVDAPAVREPGEQLAAGTVTVRLYLDAREPEKQKLWEPRLRRRLELASEQLEAAAGLRLEVVDVGTWTPGRQATTWGAALRDFEESVAADSARLVIGFTRQFPILADEFAETGGLHAPLGTHLLVPEATVGVTADQSLNMLLHELGHFLGAVHVPEPSSPMRPFLSEPARPWQVAFDPANALLMRMVADEVRTRGVQSLAELSANRRQQIAAIQGKLNAALQQGLADRNSKDPPAARPAAPAAVPKPADAAAMPKAKPEPRAGATAAPVFEPLPVSQRWRVTEVPVPDILGGYAIWSGCSRDRGGRVWFAVSATEIERPSAHLFCWDPASRSMHDHGDVISNLEAAGKYRAGELGGLICTSIIESLDGHLFFASVGEDRPYPDGGHRPPWGSHLWQVDGKRGAWRHLGSVPEGISAVALHGDFLYALGYPGHVLHQVQLSTGTMQRVEIGSTAGHVCRTLVLDSRGHPFVPRVTITAGEPPQAELVELNQQLQPISGTPLDYFGPSPIAASPGILNELDAPDGSTVFVTASGAVYRIRERLSEEDKAPVEVVARGNPASDVQIHSLAIDGEGQLFAAVSAVGDVTGGLALVSSDLERRRRVGQMLNVTDKLPKLQLYGATQANRAGDFWLAGSYQRGTLQLAPPMLEALKQRGFSDQQMEQLQENARRTRQPVLFLIQGPTSTAAP